MGIHFVVHNSKKLMLNVGVHLCWLLAFFSPLHGWFWGTEVPLSETGLVPPGQPCSESAHPRSASGSWHRLPRAGGWITQLHSFKGQKDKKKALESRCTSSAELPASFSSGTLTECVSMGDFVFFRSETIWSISLLSLREWCHLAALWDRGSLFSFLCSQRRHNVRKPLRLGSRSLVCIFGFVSYYKLLCKFLPPYTKVFLPGTRLRAIGPTCLPEGNPMGLYAIPAGAMCNVRAVNLNQLNLKVFSGLALIGYGLADAGTASRGMFTTDSGWTLSPATVLGRLTWLSSHLQPVWCCQFVRPVWNSQPWYTRSRIKRLNTQMRRTPRCPTLRTVCSS